MSIQIDMQFEELVAEQSLRMGPARGFVDNLVYDHSYTDFQTGQEAQVAACRNFYMDESSLSEVDDDEVFFKPETKTEVRITVVNQQEVEQWLKHYATFLLFKPSIVEDERGLILVF